MLSFVDRDKKILVYRVVDDGSGAPRRERVGAVPKKDFRIGPELQTLDAAEADELSEVIAQYQQMAALRLRATALGFPELVSDILRYAEESATDLERKLIFAAFTDGMRRMRRLANEDGSIRTDAAP